MNLHIYTAQLQPATKFTDSCGLLTYHGGWKPNTIVRTQCCGEQRRVKNCEVQVYYEGINVWCAEGKGCKDPKVIAAKRRREYRNRSKAQKARWRTVV